MADKSNQMDNTGVPYSGRTIVICVSLFSTFLSGPLALLAVGWYSWAAIALTINGLIMYAFPVTRILIKSEKQLQFILFRVAPAAYLIDL